MSTPEPRRYLIDERLPALLTIDEAAALLRVGRTKAYAMAAEWRATKGATGLPVVAFGRVLRVPLRVLEELIGAQFTPADSRPQPDDSPVLYGDGVEIRRTNAS